MAPGFLLCDNVLLHGLKRREKGKLLQKTGRVKITFLSHDYVEFQVLGNTDVYTVSFLDGVIRCACDDFYNQWQKEGGAFLCQHIWGCIEELKELEVIFMKSYWDLQSQTYKEAYINLKKQAITSRKLKLMRDLDMAFGAYETLRTSTMALVAVIETDVKDLIEDIKDNGFNGSQLETHAELINRLEEVRAYFHKRAIFPLQKIEAQIMGKLEDGV